MDHSYYQEESYLRILEALVASALLLCAEMSGRVQISDECGGEEECTR